MQFTSIDSYKRLEHIGNKQLAVYDSIKRQGTASNYDIAKDLNWEINRVTGRVKELREMNLVEEDHKDMHPITNRTVIYWKVVGQEV